MATRDHQWAGTLDEHAFDSQALTGNPLGDPHVRPLYVYTPPAYAAEPDRRFPTLYVIQGLTGMVEMWRNRKPFQPNVLERVDTLFADPATPPAIVVYVDAFTALGGSPAGVRTRPGVHQLRFREARLVCRAAGRRGRRDEHAHRLAA